MVTIDPEAAPSVAVAAVPALLAAMSGRARTSVSLLALPLAVAAFFRDPDRAADTTEPGPDVVVAPADGRVMHAGPGQPGVAPTGQWQQVSIFLSAFDVHINRAPYAGRLTEVTYRPGRWLAAYRHESAHLNERTDLTVVQVVAGEERTVVFRQIVGLMARRVVTRVRSGQTVRSGQRIGMMKFGSRMDVFVPLDAVLQVSAGDRVVAGETVLARWPAAEPGTR